MPGLVVGTPAFTVAAGAVPISVATRSGVFKQGEETVNTTGHTAHHVVEVVADTASNLVLPYGFFQWMNQPLPACRILIDAELVILSAANPDATVSEIVPVTFNGLSTLDVTLDGTAMPRHDSDVINRTVSRGQWVGLRSYARAHSGSAYHGAAWYSGTDTGAWFQTGNHLGEANPVIPTPGAFANTYYCHPVGLFAGSWS